MRNTLGPTKRGYDWIERVWQSIAVLMDGSSVDNFVKIVKSPLHLEFLHVFESSSSSSKFSLWPHNTIRYKKSLEEDSSPSTRPPSWIRFLCILLYRLRE